MALRILFLTAALLSLFWLPWPVTVALGFAAAFLMPGAAAGLGLLAEVLYGSGGMPYLLLAGLLGTILAILVRSFVKTRIMGA